MTTLQSTVEISIDIELLSRIGSKKFMSYGAVTRVSSTLKLKRARPARNSIALATVAEWLSHWQDFLSPCMYMARLKPLKYLLGMIYAIKWSNY